MKVLFNMLALIFTVLVSSCSIVEEPDFVYNKESLSLKNIAKVEIYDLKGNKATQISSNYLKEKWESQIKEEEGITVILEKFEILESIMDNGERTYFLKAKSIDGTIETGAFLTKDKNINKLYDISSNSYLLGSKTCTCEGCSSGCNLTVTGSICSCSPCPPGPNQCVKTETVVIEDK